MGAFCSRNMDHRVDGAMPLHLHYDATPRAQVISSREAMFVPDQHHLGGRKGRASETTTGAWYRCTVCLLFCGCALGCCLAAIAAKACVNKWLSGSSGLNLRQMMNIDQTPSSAALTQGGLSPPRLRFTNGCKDEALWVGHAGGGGTFGDASQRPEQSRKLEPLESWDLFDFPSGREPMRFWSKWRCVLSGESCSIGDSGGAGQMCDEAAGCAPPLDTKLEITFGVLGEVCNTAQEEFDGCDFVDASLKDGFTVPFELQIQGNCKGQFASDIELIHQVVSCRNLTMDKCPDSENLDGASMSLEAINPAWFSIAGCHSPCSKLSYQEWNSSHIAMSRMEASGDAALRAPFCCPTKEACEDHISRTRYVNAVHEMCPGVNAYAYDDGLGMGTCPAGTKYEMIFFCPTRRPADVVKHLQESFSASTEVPSSTSSPSFLSALPRTTRQPGGTEMEEEESKEKEEAKEEAKEEERGERPLQQPGQQRSESSGLQQTRGYRPHLPGRLRISNGCEDETFWIEGLGREADGAGANLFRLDPRHSKDLEIKGGLGSTRFWPRLRCNSEGRDCAIGESSGCNRSDRVCAPGVDTRLEGNFGIAGTPCDLRNGHNGGCDFLDLSLTSGYTVPFKLSIHGDCKSVVAWDTAWEHEVVDCSGLTLDRCPCVEDFSLRALSNLTLRAVGPRSLEPVGCYSPCSRLTHSQWAQRLAKDLLAEEAVDHNSDISGFCCPVPRTPVSCRAGPASTSKYVQAVHSMCSRASAYPYDAQPGLIRCPAGTKYELTFLCPTKAQTCPGLSSDLHK